MRYLVTVALRTEGYSARSFWVETEKQEDAERIALDAYVAQLTVSSIPYPRNSALLGPGETLIVESTLTDRPDGN